MYEEVLAGRRRAEVVSLPPVGKGLVVILLLVVLRIVGEVLDTLRAVCSVFTLSRHLCSREEQGNGQNCKNRLFHILNSVSFSNHPTYKSVSGTTCRGN